MLTLDQAHRLIDQHLGDAPRAAHSVFVADIMRGLAVQLGHDALIWELTGLCHDLDFIAVAGDWSRYGLLAAEWLADDLPPDALEAIRAHDHRTGVTSNTSLAAALKLSDALAIIHDDLGTTLVDLLAADDRAGLAERLVARPWLQPMLVNLSAAIGISLPELAPLVTAAASRAR